MDFSGDELLGSSQIVFYHSCYFLDFIFLAGKVGLETHYKRNEASVDSKRNFCPVYCFLRCI